MADTKTDLIKKQIETGYPRPRDKCDICKEDVMFV